MSLKSQYFSFFKKILIFIIIVFLYCFLFIVFYNLLKEDNIYPYESNREMIVNFSYNYFPILAIFTINSLNIFKWKKWSFIDKYVFLKIAIDFVISLLILVLVNYSFLSLMGIFKPDIKLNWMGTLLNSVLVFMGLETFFYIQKSYDSLKKIEFARRNAIQYQYESLKAQVNPHFLFNSLNILYSLISIDQKKSKEFVKALSSMYRYIIENQNNNTILVKDELLFLDSFILILKMRYHNQFYVNITKTNSSLQKKIIPYTMQLLVENITKHNIISTRDPMEILIIIGPENIMVSNPIRYKAPEQSTGIGLQYITEQYKFYNKNFEKENTGKEFIAKVPYL